MKKILSIVLLFASILALTSCLSGEYDKSIYVSDDHSYLMIHDTKYIRLDDLPVEFDIYGFRRELRYRNFDDANSTMVYEYTAAQKHPWVSFSDEYHWLWSFEFPNGAEGKYLEGCGTYCLPNDFEYATDLFSNFRWSTNKAGIEVIGSVKTYELSEKLSSYFINNFRDFEETKLDAVILKAPYCCQREIVIYDEKRFVEREIFTVYFFSEKDIYVVPSYVTDSKQDDNNGNTLDLQSVTEYRVSEEYREELIAAFREAYKEQGKEIFWPE